MNTFNIQGLNRVALIPFLSFSMCVLVPCLSFSKSSTTVIAHKKPADSIGKWEPGDGWNDLRPGVDRLPKAMAKLGTPSKIDKANFAYYFEKDAVTIGLNLNSNVIGRIEIASSYPDKNLMPKTMQEVQKRYGPLDNMGSNKLGGFIYKRRGLEVISDCTKVPEAVSLMSFSDPQSK